MASSICVMPIRLRRKRSKSPKVMNFSSVPAGMEVAISSLSYSTLLYIKFGIFESFVKFCQIKANYAKGGMLEWEYKRPARNHQAQVQPVEEGDQNVYPTLVLCID